MVESVSPCSYPSQNREEGGGLSVYWGLLVLCVIALLPYPLWPRAAL